MPDDDLLQSILDDEDNVETEQGTAATDSKPMRDMRAQIDRLEKALKKVSKENDDLKGFKVQVVKAQTESKVQEAFGQIWSDADEAARNAKLYFRGISDPEQVTEESLTEYVNEFGPKREPDASETQTGEELGPYSKLSAKFAPAPEGEPPVQGVFSSQDMAKLLMEGDADAVNRAVKAGRFKKEASPWPTDRV